MCLRQKATVLNTFFYILFQCLGATTGAVIATFISPTTANFLGPLPEGMEIGRVVVSEVMYTFFLTSCVLNSGTVKNKAEATFTGIAIGLTVIMGVVAGSAVNPAVDIGRIISATFLDEKYTELERIWIYCVGPFIGSILASTTFFMINWDEAVDIWKEMKESKWYYIVDHLF
jgi:glycerol uptake facilitator-like aquaporin